jgi:hypothetical protein
LEYRAPTSESRNRKQKKKRITSNLETGGRIAPEGIWTTGDKFDKKKSMKAKEILVTACISGYSAS